MLLESSCKPLVVTGLLKPWLTARSWSAEDICQDLSATPPTTFKLFYKSDTDVYCTYVKAFFSHFKEWLEWQKREFGTSLEMAPPSKRARMSLKRDEEEVENTGNADSIPLLSADRALGASGGNDDVTPGSANVPPSLRTNPLCLAAPSRDYWVYADYKYMCNTCVDAPALQQVIDWGVLGFKGRGWRESVLWVGSQGACTPCHYDTYGFNLVAQLSGAKKWLLFPPENSGFLYPTRIPFEELSVFSEVDVGGPNFNRHPLFRKATPYEVSVKGRGFRPRRI